MIRQAAIALVLMAGAASAAPVPKQLRAVPATTGTWQIIAPDPKKPGGYIAASGQYWIIDDACGVIFCPTVVPPVGAKPTEIFKFDPISGHVDHTLVGGTQRTLLGRFQLKDDILTICLDTVGTTRPEALQEPASIWYLRRVKESR